MVTKEALEYLEVNLHDLHVITGTKTQGRFGNGQGQEYAEEFMLDYWRPGFNKWMRWKSRDKKDDVSILKRGGKSDRLFGDSVKR